MRRDAVARARWVAGVAIGGAVAVSCGDLQQATPEDDTDAATTIPADPTASDAPTDGITSDGDGDGDTNSQTPDDDASADTGASGFGAPYPLVLAHGFFGFDELAGINAADYFFDVAPALATIGETQVFTPAVDPFNDSTVRGAQLLVAVQDIVEQTGHDKVVLIGHSQGGLDARVVASVRPDLVAAVVTIATPHHGTPVADVVLGLVADPGAQSLIDALVNVAGAGLWDAVDGDSSLSLSMQQMSQPGISAFNAQYPDAPGVRYVSVAGRSNLAAGGEACAADNPPPWVTQWVDERDPIDALFAATGAFLSQSVVSPQANDGLVRVADARWGEFLGCIPADHTDQIGQVFGDAPGPFNAWRHRDFWIALAQWIRAEGL